MPKKLSGPTRPTVDPDCRALSAEGSKKPAGSVVIGEVTALVPEFGQAGVMCADGRALVITRLTEGVDWRALVPGQRLRMHVQGSSAPRVVSAELVA